MIKETNIISVGTVCTILNQHGCCAQKYMSRTHKTYCKTCEYFFDLKLAVF